MRTVRALIVSCRPRQWVKNVFVLAALVFARRMGDARSVSIALAAFASFSFTASGVYFLNDIIDAPDDRKHPDKAKRPIAAGAIGIPAAAVAGLVLAVSGVWLAVWIGRSFLGALLLYLALNALYSLGLKRIVILDVMIIASGFVIRAVAGALALNVEISPWLLICTTMLSLFLAFTKRRQELVQLGGGAGGHRKALQRYSIPFLDQVIGVATASCVMSYALYCVSPEIVKKFGTDNLKWTIPFVIFGIFRYLYLSHIEQHGADPTSTLLADAPLLINVALWGATVVIVLYGAH